MKKIVFSLTIILFVSVSFIYAKAASKDVPEEIETEIQKLQSPQSQLVKEGAKKVREHPLQKYYSIPAVIDALQGVQFGGQLMVTRAGGASKKSIIEELILTLKFLTGQDFGEDHDKWKNYWEKNEEHYKLTLGNFDSSVPALIK